MKTFDWKKNYPEKCSVIFTNACVIRVAAYISSFGDIIRKFRVDSQYFADDTQLYVLFDRGVDDQVNAIDNLRNCYMDIGKLSCAN